MTRLIVLGVLIGAFILLFRSIFSPSSATRKKVEPTEMIQCLECKTYIPMGQAVTRTKNQKEFQFCSEKCSEEFINKNESGM